MLAAPNATAAEPDTVRPPELLSEPSKLVLPDPATVKLKPELSIGALMINSPLRALFNARPGEAAHLQPQDQADMVQCNLGQQALAAAPVRGAFATLALIFIDDNDPVLRPAQGDGSLAQPVLAWRTRCC